MTSLDNNILLGGNVASIHAIPARPGDTVNLKVRLSKIINRMDVRFSFVTERNTSIQFDIVNNGVVIFPVGVAHHGQTILVPWYAIRPIEPEDLPDRIGSQVESYDYIVTGDAQVARPNFVRDWFWSGDSGVTEVVFVTRKPKLI